MELLDRITVYDALVGWLATGMTEQKMLADYPDLISENIRACLAYAAEREHRIARMPRSV